VAGRVYGRIEAKEAAVEEVLRRLERGAAFHAGGVVVYPGGLPGFIHFDSDWYIKKVRSAGYEARSFIFRDPSYFPFLPGEGAEGEAQ